MVSFVRFRASVSFLRDDREITRSRAWSRLSRCCTGCNEQTIRKKSLRSGSLLLLLLLFIFSFFFFFSSSVNYHRKIARRRKETQRLCEPSEGSNDFLFCRIDPTCARFEKRIKNSFAADEKFVARGGSLGPLE